MKTPRQPSPTPPLEDCATLEDCAESTGADTPDGPPHAPPLSAQTSTVPGAPDAAPPFSAHDLRRLLGASETVGPEPSSRAREHQPRLPQPSRQVTSVSSGSRVHAHDIDTRHGVPAVEVQAAHDEWLADVRSRQEHPRRQRERLRRAQKLQSQY